MRLGVFGGRRQTRRRAVDHPRRIAGMVHEIDVEMGIFLQNQVAIRCALVVKWIVRHRRKGRLQTCKSFERGLWSWIFLPVECQAAILLINRNEALVEMAVFDGVGGLLLTLEPQSVDFLPRNAFERR